ncbi:MAG TPA: PfkB family carbohydrate kinase [Candidatus Methanomethylophilaceae archaeon]|nr:PfkB family carbohydrate kinase [Candidatus Methanomethylophilaceae archaeon]
MKPFLSVYGHVTVDSIVTVEEFPELNTTVDITSKSTFLGGTGANIAMTAAKLGVPTALCALVGTDLPGELYDTIKDSGVIMDEVIAVDGWDTSTAIVVNDSKLDQKVLFFQGPQGFATQIGIEMTKMASKSKYVHFCTGEPEYHTSMMSKIRSPGMKIALDPAQEVHRLWDKDKLTRAMEYTDFVFSNKYEAESILKHLGLSSLNEIGKELAVCTKGDKGSTGYLNGKEFDIPAIIGNKAVDATGAGDSYRAGFYAGLYRGMSIEDSLTIASSVASFIVEQSGATSNIPTWEQTYERAKDHFPKA